MLERLELKTGDDEAAVVLGLIMAVDDKIELVGSKLELGTNEYVVVGICVLLLLANAVVESGVSEGIYEDV